MSFILDALKKSELERQRQLTPGLVDAGIPRRRRWPAWAVALTVLLAVNLALLSVYLWRASARPTATAARVTAPAAVHDTGADRSPARGAVQGTSAALAATVAASSAPTEAAPPPAPSAAPSPPGYFSPLDSAAEYAPEVPVTAASPGAPPATRAAAPTPHPDSDAAARDRAGANDAADGAGEVLPSIEQLNLDGKLPALHLDVHVYATNPADRFVYINMRRYREGSTLAEGPVVRAIRRDGVVLDYQGVRFLLPRE